MVATITKIGEGAFADVFGCYADDWKQLALKVWTGVVSDMGSLLRLSRRVARRHVSSGFEIMTDSYTAIQLRISYFKCMHIPKSGF